MGLLRPGKRCTGPPAAKPRPRRPAGQVVVFVGAALEAPGSQVAVITAIATVRVTARAGCRQTIATSGDWPVDVRDRLLGRLRFRETIGL